MEEFNKKAKEQEDLGKKIQTLLTNARKDPAKRKTQNWRSKRAEQLQEFWNEIQQNHEELKVLGPTLRTTHNYFELKYFDQLTALHEDAKKYLESVQTSPDVDPEQEARIRRQLFRLQKISTELTKINSDLDQDYSRARYEFLAEKIQGQWRSIMELHEEIYVHEREFEDKYFADEMYEKTEEKYEVVVEKLKRKIQSPSAHQQEKPNIQLPQIKLPTFSGNYEDWPTFHDLFSKVIHKNTSLSNIEKMQYLKTYIRDEPIKIIQHHQITENNYQTAWELLAKRFNNVRLTVSKLLDKILDQPRMQEESAEKLKKLHDTTKECLEALNNLDIQTDTWGPILTKIVSQKWDTETNRLYEQSLNNPHDMQEFEKMMEFLQTRFLSLEIITANKKEDAEFNKVETISNLKSCRYCQECHSIYECPDFQAESPEDRWRFINNEQLCTNCLSHDAGKQCFSTASCHKCKRRHHTLLHNDRKSNPKVNQQKTFYSTNKQTPNTGENSTKKIQSHVGIENKQVLLATALIRVRTANGTYEYLRALIDPGSQASLITEKAATLLSLPREHIQADITGLGGEIPNKSNSKIRVECAPRFTSDFTLTTDLLVLPKITESLPEEDIETDLQVWQNHIIADPVFQDKGPIDVLLGAGEYRNIVLNGIQKTNDGLMGQKTEFGWILSGTIIKEEKRNNKCITVKSMMTRKESRQAAGIGKTASRPKRNPSTLRKMASVPVTSKPTTRPVVANLAPPKIHQQLTPIKEAMVQTQHTKRIRKGRIRNTVRTSRNNMAKDNSAHCKIQQHHQQHRPNNDHGCNLGSMVPHYRKKQRTQPRPQEEAVKMRPTYPPRVS
ncbi:hypothetical protein Zmor_021885 [Zophobas morio]|uniref:Peptidase A2 domain-containing protein n=1 Tax=Zophobas morio TaxID=2755281 RepID=A0AA38MBL7_9CUCU|nr:hypothetical protein Zmor_021885 [Zophobas morio]